MEDFWCRYLVLKDFFIPLCESFLLTSMFPLWNKVIDGFGNKVVGAGREEQQQKSMWDVLHPGRIGAAAKKNKKYPTAKACITISSEILCWKAGYLDIYRRLKLSKQAEKEGEKKTRSLTG